MAVATPRVELWTALQVSSGGVNRQGNGWGEDRQKVLQMMLGHFNHHNQKNSATLDLLGLPGSDLLELDQEQRIPSGWEKVLDLKSGAVYYVNSATGSRTAGETGDQGDAKHQMLEKSFEGAGGGGGTGTLDLRLNLWASGEGEDSNLRPAATTIRGRRGSLSVSESSNVSSMVSPSASSSPSSCISSERASPGDQTEIAMKSNEDAEIPVKNSSNPGIPNNHNNNNANNAMVLVGCPRCLMYVMLSREDPRCPKCKSSVLLDFPHAESSKRPRTSSA